MIACLKFGKDIRVAYISHLDVIRVFERALRRANLPLRFSQGFSPRPKLVFAQALPLGITSSGEYLDIHLEEEIKPHDLLLKLAKVMPQGFELYEAVALPESIKPVMAVITHASYLIYTSEPELILQAKKKISLPYINRKGGKTKEVDLKPLIRSIELIDEGVRVLSQAGSKANLRPEALLWALGVTKPLRIHREDLYLERDGQLISPLRRS